MSPETPGSFCERHSARISGVALCRYPASGDAACHECNAIMPPRPSSEGFTPPLARFCTMACASAWDAAHPGYWNT